VHHSQPIDITASSLILETPRAPRHDEADFTVVEPGRFTSRFDSVHDATMNQHINDHSTESRAASPKAANAAVNDAAQPHIDIVGSPDAGTNQINQVHGPDHNVASPMTATPLVSEPAQIEMAGSEHEPPNAATNLLIEYDGSASHHTLPTASTAAVGELAQPHTEIAGSVHGAPHSGPLDGPLDRPGTERLDPPIDAAERRDYNFFDDLDARLAGLEGHGPEQIAE
jgi:hypothetical protein